MGLVQLPLLLPLGSFPISCFRVGRQPACQFYTYETNFLFQTDKSAKKSKKGSECPSHEINSTQQRHYINNTHILYQCRGAATGIKLYYVT